MATAAADLRAGGDAPRYPTPAMGWLTVAILFVLYILSFTDRNIMALMVEPIKADLGLSDFQLSLLQGPAFALLYCAFAVPVGMALDRYSRRWVLYFAVTLWSLAAASCGLAGSFAALFLARAMVGAGEAGFSAGAYSVVGDSFPPERVSLAMSIFIMGGVTGAGVVFLIGGPIVGALMKSGPSVWPLFGELAPWRQVFLVTGLPGVLLALGIFLFREPPRTRRVATDTGGYGEAFAFVRAHARFFAPALIGFGLAQAAIIGFQLWLPSFFIRVHGWSPARVGVTLGIVQVGAALLMPIHGWVVDRLYRAGRHDAPMFWCLLTSIAAAPFGIAAPLMSDPYATVALYAVFMTLILSTGSMGPAAVQMATPLPLRGRVSAIYVFVIGIIAVAGGPSVVAFFTDKVLHDPMKVGLSLIASIFCILLPAAALFALGRPGLRRLRDSVQ